MYASFQKINYYYLVCQTIFPFTMCMPVLKVEGKLRRLRSICILGYESASAIFM